MKPCLINADSTPNPDVHTNEMCVRSIGSNNIIYTRTEVGDIPHDPGLFVTMFYGLGLSLIGGVALLFIMYGSYVILVSQGASEEVKKGKSFITYAIIAILLAILGYAIIQILAVNILHLPGFSA